MAKISMPVEAANKVIKDRRTAGIMQRAAERWNPRAMYFSTIPFPGTHLRARLTSSGNRLSERG